MHHLISQCATAIGFQSACLRPHGPAVPEIGKDFAQRLLTAVFDALDKLKDTWLFIIFA